MVKAMVKVGILLLLVMGFVAALALWPRHSHDTVTSQGDWTCSMHPQIRQPRPGKCPICGMDLVPVGQLSSEQAKLAERAGVEMQPIAFRQLFKEVRTVGKLDYNERRVAYITARIAGRVDRVYADFTGIRVKKDDHLVDIYSPDLFVAQNELHIALARYKELKGSAVKADLDFADATLEAARQKLKLLGILPEQIREIEKTKKITTHLTIYAPMAGTVIEKNIRAGQYVKEGDPLYRLADLDPIWLFMDIYEYDLSWILYGQKVDVTLEAFPRETFHGTVVFIEPFLDDRTRTVRVRVNLPNPEGKLKAAMYASAVIRVRLRGDATPEPTGLEGKYMCPMHPEVVRDNPGKCPICEMPLERVPGGKQPPAKSHEGHKGMKRDDKGMEHDHSACPAKQGKVLAVPASAVLDTGRRKVVYRQNAEGAYELVEPKLGPLAEGKNDAGKTINYYPVLSGLEEGDLVVVRGGFLLDSQRQIEGMPSLLYPEGRSVTSLHSGHGADLSQPKVGMGDGHKKH